MREEDTVVHTTVKAQLTTYYSIYCPEKVDNIDKILKLFNGRYDVLNEKLQRKVCTRILLLSFVCFMFIYLLVFVIRAH